jgi:hypothetical protein
MAKLKHISSAALGPTLTFWFVMLVYTQVVVIFHERAERAAMDAVTDLGNAREAREVASAVYFCRGCRIRRAATSERRGTSLFASPFLSTARAALRTTATDCSAGGRDIRRMAAQSLGADMKMTSILCASGAALLGATALLAACGSDSKNEASSDTASAFAELQRAVDNCAATRASCVAAAAGNATAATACETAYDACAASAGKDAEHKLAQAAAQCAQTARTCRDTAADKKSCADVLKMCLGELPHGDGGVDGDDASDESDESDEDASSDESAGDGGKPSDVGGGKPSDVGGGSSRDAGKPSDVGGGSSRADAGRPGDVGGSANPNSECHTQLVTCMDQGGAAKDCAAGVRDCISSAGKGEHGKPAQDGGGAAQGGQGQSGDPHGKPDAGT